MRDHAPPRSPHPAAKTDSLSRPELPPMRPAQLTKRASAYPSSRRVLPCLLPPIVRPTAPGARDPVSTPLGFLSEPPSPPRGAAPWLSAVACAPPLDAAGRPHPKNDGFAVAQQPARGEWHAITQPHRSSADCRSSPRKCASTPGGRTAASGGPSPPAHGIAHSAANRASRGPPPRAPPTPGTPGLRSRARPNSRARRPQGSRGADTPVREDSAP